MRGWVHRSAPALLLLRSAFYAALLWERFRDRRAGFEGFSTWYAELWRRAAAQLGAEFTELPGGFCELRYGSRVTRTQEQRVMLDDPVTLELAGNKAIVHKLLSDQGLPVPPYRAFDMSGLESALDFLREQRHPCVVKPAAGTGGGKGVTTGVRTEWDLTLAAVRASLFCPTLLIERQIKGDSYRLLYLDGKLLDAVRRPSPAVVGDGRSSIAGLIRAENQRRLQTVDGKALGPLAMDLDCRATLRMAGLSLHSVPPAGARITVKEVSNQAGDGELESARSVIGKELTRQGARAAAVIGVRLAGIDVITPDPGVSLEESGGVINEVNTTPGLRFHYLVKNTEDMVPVAVPILQELLGLPDPAMPAFDRVSTHD